MNERKPEVLLPYVRATLFNGLNTPKQSQPNYDAIEEIEKIISQDLNVLKPDLIVAVLEGVYELDRAQHAKITHRVFQEYLVCQDKDVSRSV